MTFDELRAYLLSRPEASEETPFGPEALVYKVVNKVFAILAWQATPLRLSLKCRPADALALRERYPAVIPGYHLNKRHWNTVILDGSVPDAEVAALIDESHRLVILGLPKADRLRIAIKIASV